MAGKEKKDVAPQGFSQKHWKKLSSSYKEGAESKSNEELEEDIVKNEAGISSHEKMMEEDETLAALRAQVKDKAYDYKEPIAELTAQIKYATFLLKNRGVR